MGGQKRFFWLAQGVQNLSGPRGSKCHGPRRLAADGKVSYEGPKLINASGPKGLKELSYPIGGAGLNGIALYIYCAGSNELSTHP